MKLPKNEDYAWLICFGCALSLFCAAGLSTTGFSAYQPYLIALQGLSNTQMSTVLMVRSLTSVVGMFLADRAISRFGIRRVVSASTLVCSISFFVYGVSDGFIVDCIAAGLAGLALGFGGMIATSVLITRWFNVHRGLALGICMAATGLSAFVASPVITFLVENMSLRFSFFAEGIFVLVAAVLVYLILRSNPSCLHVQPLGSSHKHAEASFAQHSAPRVLYYGMAASILLFGMVGNTLHTHLSVLYQVAGFSSGQISNLISLFGISLAVGKCAYGQLSDKLGAFRAGCILFSAEIVGAALCCMANNNNFMIACLAVMLAGFGLAVTTVAPSTYAAHVATKEEYPHAVSLFQQMSTLGGLIFATVPGVIADATGSYVPAYVIMLILSVGSCVMIQAIYKVIRARDRQAAIS